MLDDDDAPPQYDDRERLERLALAASKLRIREECEFLEGSLIEFYRAAWPQIDPSAFADNWHLEAIAEHLEAVAYGDIRKLCINLPPRHSKTLLCSVAFQAWCWAKPADPRYPLIGPGGRFMCLSYGDQLALDNAILARRLIESPWYQERWGSRVMITDDQDAKNKFDTTLGGTRISGSFQGTVTGRGAGIRIYDDPHKMDEVESTVTREKVLRVYNTTLKSRVTDPRTSAEILVAQRGHMLDLSAQFLSDPDVVHLNLPAEYDSSRHCKTVLGWEDPRTEDGEPLWADRWGPDELKKYKADPFEWAAQWQQLPRARGGSIIKDEWWQLWDPPDGQTPPLSYVWAAADTAYTAKEENDPTGYVCWGLWNDNGQPKAILLNAWRKRLEIHGPKAWTEDDTSKTERTEKVRRWIAMSHNYHKQMGGTAPQVGLNAEPWATYIATGANNVDRWPGEPLPVWEDRTRDRWGLCEWLAFSCRKNKVQQLLIESKASGLSVVQELRRLHGHEGWGISAVTPDGDKVARLYAVQHLFSSGLVYAPDREWAQMVIDEVGLFPKGPRDDLTDATSMALKFARDQQLLVRPEERQFADEIMATYKSRPKPLYPAAGV